MRSDYLDTLSAAQREAAHLALAGVLGSVPVSAVIPVSGGATAATVLRIIAGGRSYLLRMEGTPSPLRNPHQYVSMRLAAEAGIAPRLLYADETARASVMDYIEQQPLHT
jgi:hypothetical protein